jgi:hypothetical protein
MVRECIDGKVLQRKEASKHGTYAEEEGNANGEGNASRSQAARFAARGGQYGE